MERFLVVGGVLISSLLIQEIEVDTLIFTSPTAIAQQSRQSTPAKQVIEEQDFRFELQSCKRSGRTLTCNLLVTNLGSEDIAVNLNAEGGPYAGGSKTRIIDSSGEEYRAKQIRVGNQTRQFWVRPVLVQEVPTKATIDFEVPLNVNSLAVLVFGYGLGSEYGSELHNVQFRDVRIITGNI